MNARFLSLFAGLSVLLVVIMAPVRAGVLHGPVTNPGNGHSYYLLTPSTWTEAEAEAVELGGHLAIINDAAENEWVFQTFGNVGSVSRSMWIGLSDKAEEGVFRWADGQLLDDTGWASWVVSAPSDVSGAEDYVYMVRPGHPSVEPKGFWNDFPDDPATALPGDQSLPVCGVVELPFTRKGETKVNVTPELTQASPSIANSANGDFVIVWISTESNSSDSDVYLRQYRADGTPKGDEQRVNSSTAGKQVKSCVGMAADGRVVVAWLSNDPSGAGARIYLQRYDTEGRPVGEEELVSSLANASTQLSLGMNSSGAFVLTWDSSDSTVVSAIYVKRYDASGVSQGDEFRIASAVAQDFFKQSNAQVTVGGNGRYIVTFFQETTFVSGGYPNTDIVAKSFGDDGNELGGRALKRVRYDPHLSRSLLRPMLALSENGDFTLVWVSEGFGFDFTMQRFNADGVAIGTEEIVNTPHRLKSLLSIAVDANGGPLIAWPSFGGTGENLWLRRYASSGTSESFFRLNVSKENSFDLGYNHTVVKGPAGSCTVVWKSGGQKGNGPGIFFDTLRFPAPVAAPKITNFTVNEITPTSAKFTATVDSAGANASVVFAVAPEGAPYRAVSGISAEQSPISGVAPAPVSANKSGLAPHTTYSFRIRATNDSGITMVEGGTFTTANTEPLAVDDTASVAFDSVIQLQLLDNDGDPDGDVISLESCSGGKGILTLDGSTVTYRPPANFVGTDRFTYRIRDNYGAVSTSAFVTVQVLPPVETVASVLAMQGSPVPGAGDVGSGVPNGAKWTTFGIPSINNAGEIAFLANLGNRQVIIAPKGGNSTAVIVGAGDRVPDEEGAFLSGLMFRSFQDPVLNQAGHVAFLGRLKNEGSLAPKLTSRNDNGIWTNATGGQLRLVARAGDPAIGAGDGIRWRAFTSLALSDAFEVGALDDGQRALLAFSAELERGSGGVAVDNDSALWIYEARMFADSSLRMVLREGQSLSLPGESALVVKSFAALVLQSGVQAHGGALNEDGLIVRVTFIGGRQALLKFGADGAFQLLVQSGAEIGSLGVKAKAFNVPVQNSEGQVAAIASLEADSRNSALLFLNSGETADSLVRKGDGTGSEEQLIFDFNAVAINDEEQSAFTGSTVNGEGNGKSRGLWWGQRGAFVRVWRSGGIAPGIDGSPVWTCQYPVFVLPNGSGGPVFTAKLRLSKSGSRQHGKITPSNDTGLWAVDSSGATRLIVREGDEVDGKKIRSFQVLNLASGSPAQRRSFNDHHGLVYRAVFTDGSQAIMRVILP